MIPIIGEPEFWHKIVESEVPVLVDFFAPWCMPCKMAHREVRKVAAHFGDRLLVIRVDIDQSTELANSLKIKSIPTFVLFQVGDVAPVGWIGLIDHKVLINAIETELASTPAQATIIEEPVESTETADTANASA